MKHIFVINPAAGSSDVTQMLRAEITEACEGREFEIYRTGGPGDAADFVRTCCVSDSQSMRFYACGGDGTLSEVINGVIGFPHASVSCYPCGSGNDFVKYYGGKERFLDIPALMTAPEKEIDVMRVEDRYCVNVCNFGFDTAVAKMISRFKTKPFLSGKRAYYAGVLKALVTSMKTNGRVVVDGEELFSGDFLLCTVANGNYVGSSFQCAPRSQNDDGLMEICLVKTVSRPKFMRLIGPYTRGEHLEDPKFSGVILYKQGASVEVSSNDSGFAYTMDGEVIEKPSFKIETVKRAVRFAVPE